MVFSSLPSYHHDQPNWQQQPANHAPPPPQLPGGAGSIRPGSMADRARMANIPLPEPALKCPRCDSTNTKFCYFNNYSLTQPRHFCKTCRRYWTRGGALRTVPVGGGCRRNKRSKSTPGGGGSKNPSTSAGGNNNNSPAGIPSSGESMLGLPVLQRFMAPLHHHHPALAEFSGEIGLNSFGAGLSYGGDLGFHVGNASAPASLEQWRFQAPQFPFLPSGLEPAPAGLFEGEVAGFGARAAKATSSGITDQMASVKMEDSNGTQAEMNLSRQFFGAEHYWNGGAGNGGSSAGAWTDFSGFSSSSTTSNQL